MEQAIPVRSESLPVSVPFTTGNENQGSPAGQEWFVAGAVAPELRMDMHIADRSTVFSEQVRREQ